MEENIEISEKERERRRKISIARKKAIEEKRIRGYKAYLVRLRREIRKKKTKERHEKEKLKKQKERERLKRLKYNQKNHKIGRPKKRGPKKKYKQKKNTAVTKKRVIKQPKNEPNYRLLSYRNGKQNAQIGEYFNITDVYAELQKLLKQSDVVIFPATIDVHPDVMKQAVDEYLIIERGYGENQQFRNEYGKFIETKLLSDKWHIIDKVKYTKEETFWVYGMDKYNDRKTFLWIYKNLLVDDIYSKYDYKRVLVYKNKVIFKDDDNNITMILCKHTSDAVKFYNLLQTYVKKDKLKNILFIGDFTPLSPKRKILEKEIMDLTGWDLKRVQMTSTSYFRKKNN